MLSEMHSSVELYPPAPFWRFPGVTLLLVFPSFVIDAAPYIVWIVHQCKLVVCIVISELVRLKVTDLLKSIVGAVVPCLSAL